MAFLKARRPAILNANFRRVDRVVGAVIKGYFEIDGWKSRQCAFQARFLDSFFDGRDILLRNRASKYFVGELKLRTSRERFNANLAISELAVTAGLFLVPPLDVSLTTDGFSVRNSGRFEVYVHSVAPLQARDSHLDMHLTLS